MAGRRKKCRVCKEIRALDEFHGDSFARDSDGKGRLCRDCNRIYMRVTALNQQGRAVGCKGRVSYVDVQKALLRANKKCESCSLDKRLSVTHHLPLHLHGTNHGSNLIVLCQKCMRLKGRVVAKGTEDRLISAMEKAIALMENHSKGEG